MPSPYPRTFLLSALLLLAALPAWSQDRGLISGKVSEKKTGHALPFATIAVPEHKPGGLTASEGQFRIPGILPGTVKVRVQFLGYKPESRQVVVTAGKTTTANFQLTHIVVH